MQRHILVLPALLVVAFIWYAVSRPAPVLVPGRAPVDTEADRAMLDSIQATRFDWSNLTLHYPVAPAQLARLPQIRTEAPAIQLNPFPALSPGARGRQAARLAAVKSNFTHAWAGYKQHAWLRDEVAPLSGSFYDTFGGWGATLVDALGTLWIMGLHGEFRDAVEAVGNIDFTTCGVEELNVFETTIRYLGGLLSAYDLSDGQYPQLLIKATELGEMLYHAFDTPNRMPVARWKWQAALAGAPQAASESTLLAELGSLTLEFTRLSQLTGDSKYYDAVDRVAKVLQQHQMGTLLPGLWPVVVDASSLQFRQLAFTIGGMADSAYEYLPKQYLLTREVKYRDMYEAAVAAMDSVIFYRPMVPDGRALLLAGSATHRGVPPATEPEAQHLSCFAGGMVGLGARLLGRPLDTAVQLVEGCLWAYEAMPLGIMPEIFHAVACPDAQGPTPCAWNETAWHEAMLAAHTQFDSVEELLKNVQLPQGVAKIDDARPEAIESVFYLYRMTGNETYLDRAWSMFESIIKHTKTSIAHAGLADCSVDPPPQQDKMESFWLAETLRYFFLIFSEPGVVSLDEWVLNTEAHPLRLS